MSNPTPDHNVTRDNQQPPQSPQLVMGHASFVPHKVAPPDRKYPDSPLSDKIRDMLHAPAQPSGDGQRTPESLCRVVAGPNAWSPHTHLAAPIGAVKRLLDELAYRESEIVDLRAQLQAATERADALQRECRSIEVVAAERLGWVNISRAECEETRKGRDNYIKLYTGAVDDLTAARAELAKVRDCAGKLAQDSRDVLASYLISKRVEGGHPCPENLVISSNLKQALTAYRALAAGQGEGAGR